MRGRQSTNVKRMYFDTISNTNAVFLRSLLNRVNYIGSIDFLCNRNVQSLQPFCPEARFSKALETCNARETIAKSRTLRLQSCFIHISLISTEVSFIQEVSPLSETDELRMSLKDSGEKFPGLSRNGLLVSLHVSFTVKVHLQGYIHLFSVSRACIVIFWRL